MKLTGACLFMGFGSLAGAMLYVNLYETVVGKSFYEK